MFLFILHLEATLYPDEPTVIVRKHFVPETTNVFRSNDDRPITPMRATYTQIAAKFNKEVGLPTDPNLTDQYYEGCYDFEQDDDQSPTREKREREFSEQIIRSFNGHEGSPKNERSLSASKRSINSMSRTIDPRQGGGGGNPTRQSRYLASSKTMTSARKSKSTFYEGKNLKFSLLSANIDFSLIFT